MEEQPKPLLPPTVQDAIIELERELRVRRQVHPRWIRDRRITARASLWQQDCLQVAIDALRRLPTLEGGS